MIKKKFQIAFIILLSLPFIIRAQVKKEVKPEQGMKEMWGTQNIPLNTSNAKHGQLFTDGNYAMFIHFGLFSNLANKWKGKTYYGIGEWLMNDNMANVPIDEYMETAQTFNPENFNAEEIVKLAKDAGMKYIIITSKHHDGFAMYHSKVNTFNIVDATPFARDPMKELADACKAAEIGFGFYYSQFQDWTAPGGGSTKNTSLDSKGNKISFEEYFNKKCLPQIREITTKYGDMVLIWFDTPGTIPKEDVEKIIKEVRKNQPNALISGRIGHSLGDYNTFGDMELPIENIEGMWETVDVTNDSWAYAWYDKNWKTPKQILTNVLSTVARGGTYMLNIGPKGDGTIPEPVTLALRTSGDWIKRYPQVVYGAGASPWKHKLPWGDITTNNDKVYILIYDWPLDGNLYLPGLQNKIISAKLLGNEDLKPIGYYRESDWVIFQLPSKRPEKLVSVIELKIEGIPLVSTTLAIDPIVPTILDAHFASVTNCIKRKRSWMEKFGEWKHTWQVENWVENSIASWDIEVLETGYYQVKLNYAGMGSFETKGLWEQPDKEQNDRGKVIWKVITDEGYEIQNKKNSSLIYAKHDIGWIYFKQPGKHTVSVSLLQGDQSKTSLKTIEFIPIEK